MQSHSPDPVPLLLQDAPSTPRQNANHPSTSMSPSFFASPVSSIPSSPYPGIRRRDTYPSGSALSNCCRSSRPQSINRHVSSFPHFAPDIDLENDRLNRACGLLPPMDYSVRSSASRTHQQRYRSSPSPRSDGSEYGSLQRKVYPSAPKIHYRCLLSVLDEVLYAQGLEMRGLLNEEHVACLWEKDALLRERRGTEHAVLSPTPYGDKTGTRSVLSAYRSR